MAFPCVHFCPFMSMLLARIELVTGVDLTAQPSVTEPACSYTGALVRA